MDSGSKQTKMYSLSTLLFVSLLVAVSSSECDIPSQFWCDSPEVAKKCEVFEQCQKYKQIPKSNDVPLVQFTLYFESLCPDCKNFFAKSLVPAYKEIHSIMNLTLVPYGNARETASSGGLYNFTCQHGQLECQGNLIETCAIHWIKDISVYFPFIACMEASYLEPLQAAKHCAEKYTVPIEKILDCSTSDLGNHLEHQMAVKTDALEPKHQYVPWVTLNGVHTKQIETEAESNLIKLICTTYKGASKPAACSSA